jgi:hypothetical protein
MTRPVPRLFLIRHGETPSEHRWQTTVECRPRGDGMVLERVGHFDIRVLQ